MAESIYDNVPNLRRQLASQGLLRPTVDSWSLIPENSGRNPPENLFSPGSDGSNEISPVGNLPPFLGDFHGPRRSNRIGPGSFCMPRDISMASGILADSESSPTSPGRERFAILDSMDAAAAAATPDSAKSLTSSEGSFSALISMGKSAGIDRNREFKSGGAINRSAETLDGASLTDSSMIYCRSTSAANGVRRSTPTGNDSDRNIYDYPPENEKTPPPPSPKPRASLLAKQQRNASEATRQKSLAAASLPSLERRTSSYEMLYDTSMCNSVVGAGSPEVVGGAMLNSQAPESGFSSIKEKAELEAVEACKWLRAAGFPQYAQMYEEHKFPIDVKAVEKDHEFLDDSDIQALFRRLHALNRCAIMKLDSSNVLMRKGIEEDSDEEDTVALSRKWRYQRKSKTWSRVVPSDFVNNGGQVGTDSSTSPNLQTTMADLTAGPQTGESLDSLTFDTSEGRSNGTVGKMTDSVHVMVAEHTKRMHDAATAAGLRPPPLTGGSKTAEDLFPKRGGAMKLQRSQSERIKDKARAFMRRMGPQASSRRRKSAGSRENSMGNRRNREDIVIGSPVLVGHQSASPPAMRMFKGTPTQQQLGEDSPVLVPRVHDNNDQHRSAERLNWRQGRVFLTSDRESSSAEFEKVDVSGSPIPTPNRYIESKTTATFVDSNCNIADRVFAANQKSSSSVQVEHVTVTRRENIIGSPKTPSSPRFQPMARRAGSARSGSATNSPLILYNPRYNQGSTGGSQNSVGFASRNSLESSPEFCAKSPRDTTRQTSLRIRVDMDESRGHTPGERVQPCHSSLDSSESDSPKYWEAPERRDSGVGSSLSRSPSGPTRSRVRWHSFQRQHRPVISQHAASGSRLHHGLAAVQMDSLSVPQMIVLRQFALLRLTSLMEKYSSRGGGPKGGGPGWNWGVQKLFRRMKTPEQKGLKDRSAFGVALHVVAQRTGQPLPQCILHAMRFLRQQAPDAVGLFRKSGVRSRILRLKEQCEKSNELQSYDSQQTFDVADLLKQYFRELPEPLLTTKLSETFIGIHLDVPQELRLEAMQKAVLLLPDENREVLQSLLLFLYDVSRYSNTNHMTAQNLAVCFAPSLFQLSPRLAALSPTRRHKTIAGGMPNEKELRESQASQACLTQMIVDCKSLFLVPNGIQERCNLQGLDDESEPASLKDLGQPNGSFITHLEACIATLLKEHRDRWKGWMTEGSLDGVEITCKKLSDSHPLRLWRVWADVEAPPREVLERVLRERDTWDEDVLKWRVVERLGQQCELFQYVQNDMPPHPTREFCVVRMWKRDLPSLRGGCVLVETSVSSPDAPMIGGVKGVCLAARYLIEPSGAGRSRITYVCRMDTRGRGKAWYNKVFGYICARQIAHLRDSFRQMADGPETKV